ncbi:MAG: B12-binding domain-containing radical SAM protein, partial [Rhodospirillales bacterium]
MTKSWDNSHLESHCAELLPRLAPGKKVLLIQIPQIILGSFNREIALKRGYYAFPPTGLQYLYEAIKHRGLEVEIFDLNLEILKKVFADPNFDPLDWPRLLEEKLHGFQPALVGVSCLFDAGISTLLDALRRLRSYGKAAIVVGGVIATYEWKRLLDEGLTDFVVRGEGENRLNYLLEFFDQKLGCAPAAGIYFKADGEFQESKGEAGPIPVPGNLKDSYKLVPIESYFRYGSLNPFTRRKDTTGVAYAAIQFSRGCRAECTFCSVRDFMGRGVRHRSAESLLDEMDFLIGEKGVRHFEWLDDDLLFYRNEIKEVLRGIIDRKWNITWSANNGLIASSIDEEMMDLICRSGCLGFKIGIETGNPEMLRKVKKPGKHDKFRAFAAMLERYPQPFVGGNFIVGLPDETFGQMMDSFRFALEIGLDWAGFTVCQIIRGASAFADSGEYFEHQMKSEGAGLSNFIPARESSQGQIESRDSVFRNHDVFKLPVGAIPSEAQVKEIWFAFNMIVNYVHNKNLMPGGHPEKLVSWIETAQKAYPTNPYMMLFLALAQVELGESEKAEVSLNLARQYAAAPYWQDRFSAFYLQELLADFPESREKAYDALTKVRRLLRPAYETWMK